MKERQITRLQRRLAEKIVEDSKNSKLMNKQDLLESVGYSHETARAVAQRTISSQGVQLALAELGFTISGADKVVEQILYCGREENRLKAGDMLYKRLGAYKPERIEHTAKPYMITPEQQRILDALDEPIMTVEASDIGDSVIVPEDGKEARTAQF